MSKRVREGAKGSSSISRGRLRHGRESITLLMQTGTRNKRCRQARPLTERLDSQSESDRGRCTLFNAETPGRSRREALSRHRQGRHRPRSSLPAASRRREKVMKRHDAHCGILYQDRNKRFCLHESGVLEEKTVTCTSGCPLEVWMNREWISGHVEGDGENYWFFAATGGKFLLAERMKARYIERKVDCLSQKSRLLIIPNRADTHVVFPQTHS